MDRIINYLASYLFFGYKIVKTPNGNYFANLKQFRRVGVPELPDRKAVQI